MRQGDFSDIDDEAYRNSEDGEKVAFYLTHFAQKRVRRVNFESQWEESALLAWPEYRGSFFFGRDQAPGDKRAQQRIDSYLSVASTRHAAIAEWLLTPSNMLWSKVETSDEELMKDRAVHEWCEKVTKILWRERYKDTSNFIGSNTQNMQGFGVFGNMGMFIDELDNILDPRERGMRYMALPVGEWYVETNHQGKVVGGIRHFRLTAQQFASAAKQHGWGPVPAVVMASLKISDQRLFDILHFIRPRYAYNPDNILHVSGKKYESVYVSVQAYCILKEDGYRTLPIPYGRYMLAPDEDYGRGPTQWVLDTIKSRNAGKRVFLKQAHRAGDPAYLVYDTGLVDLKTHSGAWNAGGMSKEGHPLVGVLPTGQIQITQEMLDADKGIIDSAFLVDLFQMILGDKKNEMSPQQMVEYVNERGIILAPTLGRQCSDYLGPLHDRELDLLSWLRLLPPMPPALREAKGQVTMAYTNPVARAMQSQESAGYMRTFGFAAQAVQQGADPGLLDIFDLDTALPAIGEQNNAPISWFSSPQMLADKRKARAQAEQQENEVKSLPGKAAIIKAQAITAKAQAGQNIGGTLSGTPQGGMPMMPGQTEPGGTPPPGGP